MVSADAHTARAENRDWGFWSEDERLELWEAYVRLRRDDWDMRFGKQPVRWGRAEDIGPIDNFTPENRREYLRFNRAARKIPVWALQGVYTAAPFSYEAIVQPSFEPSPLAPSGSNWRPRRLVALDEAGWTVREDKPSDASVWAQRVRHRTDDFEAGVSHAYHYNQTPALRMRPAQSEVLLDYRRQHTFGADVALLENGSALFAEGAYTTREPFETNDPGSTDRVALRDILSLVVGFDHALDDATRVGVQWAMRNIVNDRSQLVANAFEHAVLGQIRRTVPGEKLELGVSGRYWFDPHGYILSPEIAFRLHERIRIRAMLDLYGGSRDSEPGQFRDNDQWGLELTVVF